MSKNIAIIGGGVSGLTAGYCLSSICNVEVLEKTGRLGGNAYTHTTRDGHEADIAVAAFGRAGYKNFYAMLEHFGIETALCATSYMSFHNLDTKEGAYITASLGGLLSQGFKLFRPRQMADFAKVYLAVKAADVMHRAGMTKGKTLGQVIEQIPLLKGDARVFFICTLCLLSSMSAAELLTSPADFFIEKLRVHHDILSPKAAYSVRCVKKGTKAYVNALSQPLVSKATLQADIKRIERKNGKVQITTGGGTREFDAVVFACPPSEILNLLAEPTAQEKELLGAWKHKPGKIIVHKDHASFPPRDLIQAYTFLYTNRDGVLNTSVNGALWHEPQVAKEVDYISAQHPNYPIRPDLIEFETVLSTPIFSFEACAKQAGLKSLNGTLSSYYCGSYFGYGLHEDAIVSAMSVAKALGAKVPWAKDQM